MHLKHLPRTAGCLVLMAAIAACSKSEMAGAPAPAPVAEMNVVEEAKPVPPSGAAAVNATLTEASQAAQLGSSAATYTDSERKFIRTAQARFRVKDVYVSALGIEDTVASHGGFVVRNDIDASIKNTRRHPGADGKIMELDEYKVQGHLIVRVPSARTQEFMRAIVGHVLFLDERNFAARDAQFDLLRQQLDVMRNQETQSDLGQAVKDGDKLVQKTGAIAARNDVKAARDAAHIAKKEFEDQVAFSTIELKLYQSSKIMQTERVDLDRAFEQSRPGFFRRVGENLRHGWNGLLEFTLFLIGVWPLLLIIGAITVLVMHLRRRRRKVAAPQ